MEELKNKMVAVLGFGTEGRATCQYLLKHGISPVLFDQKPWAEWSQADRDYIQKLGINFVFGPDCFKELAGFELAFRSPGIKPENLSAQTKQGLVLTSQTKWFVKHCPCKIIGITGTKGKGTTSSLIYEILKKASMTAYLTGNIGYTQPFEILDSLAADDWVVYEMSSFQLQDMEQSPHIGVVLMVTEDHLDYHSSREEYHKAKAAIAGFQKEGDFAVINADFVPSQKIGMAGKGSKVYFSRKAPVSPGCYALAGEIRASFPSLSINEKIADVSSLLLKGEHNLENICAAAAAGICAGAPTESISKAVAGFAGLEHRLELAAQAGGIKFYNDSFSTTPETAIAAIRSFSEPTILIVGGSSKKSDFSALGSEIASSKSLKAIILIGEEAGRISESIKQAGGFKGDIFTGAESMPDIFSQIKTAARPGDVVLLSPACASFGMFENYKDRGNQFKECAKAWAI